MDELFALHFDACDGEIFLAASTNIFGCLTGFAEVCGTASAVHGTLRAVRRALQSGDAQYLWVAHNHPDNSVAISNSDYVLTERIATLARLLAVQFVDHRLFVATRFHSICHGEPVLPHFPLAMAQCASYSAALPHAGVPEMAYGVSVGE